MKVKNVILFGLGGSFGFVGGTAFGFYKIFKSERMRDTLSEIVSDKIGQILYGEQPRRRYRSKVSYQAYYDKESERYTYVQEVTFQSKEDAEKIIDALKDIICTYGMATVMDYYDLCSIDTAVYIDNRYGWVESDIENMKISNGKEGYVIRMPKPIKL